MMESSTSSPHPQPQPLKQYSSTDKKLIALAMLTASCRERYEAASLKLQLTLTAIRLKVVAPASEHQDNFPKALPDLLKKGRIPDDVRMFVAEFDDGRGPDAEVLELLVTRHAFEASTKVVQYLTSCTAWKPLTDKQLEARKFEMDTITNNLSLILSFLMHPKAIAALTDRETLLALFGPDRSKRWAKLNELAHPQDAVSEYETIRHALTLAHSLERGPIKLHISEYEKNMLENMTWVNETTCTRDSDVLGVDLDLMVSKLQERLKSIGI